VIRPSAAQLADERDFFDSVTCDGSAESCRCAERDEDGNLPDDDEEEEEYLDAQASLYEEADIYADAMAYEAMCSQSYARTGDGELSASASMYEEWED
jgi:hypothetical protein